MYVYELYLLFGLFLLNFVYNIFKVFYFKLEYYLLIIVF